MRTEVLLVEDDLLSAKLIERNLLDFPQYELVHTASSLEAAKAFLADHRPGLILLDIVLPDGQGFELIPYLSPGTRVVVLTGDESYAFTAFENGAIDFLKKPVTPARFRSCIDKIGSLTTAAAPQKPYLFVKAGYKHIRVDINDLLYAEADRDYVKLFMKGKVSVLVNITMKELIARLQPYSFVQVHRSFLVNIHHIESVEDEGISISGKSIPVGKTYKSNFQKSLS